ncbi:hypothetical protein HYH38_08240 [Clostridium botulinum]|uniref:hypothetical protein n=1 Tax=Clostridium botulinum TaxID=1491 RepID=UPI001C9A9006|nr:hypothetical protein [Clostridium botulinum]MBY6816477.1 hypothetical protein [Clostridium botulinum]MBY6827268.1 hypothetical protein [Clostridium botulinum]MBY6859216.1 hypothetical protein [Clostridium botulinum]MBY7041500.1 hypothetical protein [Clostridium botulinum]NFS12773.1 hypothetical protein [Clostridium botulinum]
MLYGIIKNLIEHNYYEREDMTNKLNVFMLVNQISQDQYLELLAMINPVKVEEKPKDNIETTEDKKVEDNTETK